MRFAEIGQQLRAYRLESGLRAEEIAARLGVSRAALYRYEKGEVIKLDTVKRLAELLKVSPLSLLGIGVEYYSRSVGFFERIRQIEESADQVMQVYGAGIYLTTSEIFDATMADGISEAANLPGIDSAAFRTNAEQVFGILAARKRVYAQRRPGIIAILSPSAIQSFLDMGLLGGIKLSDSLRAQCRRVAASEIQNIATILETEPMGLQFGLMASNEPSGGFSIFRSRDRAMLAANPFRTDSLPSLQTGVAMITGADEALAAHQRVAEAMWRDAIKGPAAALRLREMVASHA